MLTKMKKRSLKFKNLNFEKRKKFSGDMMDSYPSTKFGVNSPDGFVRKTRFTDDHGWTTDDRATALITNRKPLMKSPI